MKLAQWLKDVNLSKTLELTAFTLAEVLIVIGIIGIIAEMTIPTLVTNYQKQQTAIRLKQVYSTLSNAFNVAQSEYGSMDLWTIYKANDIVPNTSPQRNGSEYFAETYLMPYLRVQRNCLGKSSDDCAFYKKYLDGTGYGNYAGLNKARFFLQDGSIVAVETFEGVYPGTVNPSLTGRAYKDCNITVDINGNNKPNTFGRDIFRFDLALVPDVIVTKDEDNNNVINETPSGKILPLGAGLSRKDIMSGNSASCNKKATGYYCAALIMYDGWEIKDDYPW